MLNLSRTHYVNTKSMVKKKIVLAELYRLI